MTDAFVLDAVEKRLTEAAELQIAGTIGEDLYISLLRGSLIALPRPQAPGHIPVLKRLKLWQQSELIPEQLCELHTAQVLSSSRSSDATTGASSTAATLEPPPQVSQPPTPVSVAKKQKLTATTQQATLFSMMPTASKTLVKASELRAQRKAALRDEDYPLEALDMHRFPTEQQHEAAPAYAKEFLCAKCARKFPSRLGFENHSRWHSETAKPKEFFTPKPAEAHQAQPHVEICLGVDADGLAAVSFLIDGLTLEAMEADMAANHVAQEERETMRYIKGNKRQRLREAEEEADRGEHRRGSNHRRSYTAKEKLWILDIWDAHREDPTVLKKKETFEANPLAKGTPYTTVKVH